MSANSVTTTMVRHSARLKDLLKPKDTWPEPLESIDFTFPALVQRDRSKLQLTQYFFWMVKGPALAAYSSIEGKIKNCLSCRDDLFEGEIESALPSSIDCYMFGPTPETAHPCIAVSCQSKSYCHKAIIAIKESDFWECFRKEHLSFKLIHLRDRPRPVRMATFHDNEILVYTSEPLNLRCGMPLFLLRPDETAVSGVARSPDSTMGGVVLLDGKPYGLTIAHALRLSTTPATVDIAGDEDCDTESTFSIIDDSDDEPICTSNMRGTTVMHADHPNSHHVSEGEFSEDVIFTEVEPKAAPPQILDLQVVGRIKESSDGSPSDELDWALIDLTDRWTQLPGIRNSEESGAFHPVLRVVEDLEDLKDLDRVKPIYTSDWDGNTIKGILNANNTLIGLQGSRELLALYRVMLQKPMFLGSCGMWILDADGNWYGHIVAGHPGSNMAYIAPAWKIQHAIEKSTGRQMRVAPLETTIPFTTTLDPNKGQTEASGADEGPAEQKSPSGFLSSGKSAPKKAQNSHNERTGRSKGRYEDQDFALESNNASRRRRHSSSPGATTQATNTMKEVPRNKFDPNTVAIMILNDRTYRWRQVLAHVNPQMSCNTITLRTLQLILGVVVLNSADEMPHSHLPYGYIGTIQLRYEHLNTMMGGKEMFCIVQNQTWPVVLHRGSRFMLSPGRSNDVETKAEFSPESDYESASRNAPERHGNDCQCDICLLMRVL
ncbi:hypothetical protein CLAIMM_10702 [Cladophialophora immunda]|nr:hypothetical protein CLAIMM_10702 [Cladophialophora immunda]